MNINFEKIGALLRELFITESGKLDILTLICALIAVAYAALVLLSPIALWRLRRETIRMRKLMQAQMSADKASRDALREIAACLAAERGARKRASRPALTEKRLAPESDEQASTNGEDSAQAPD